MIEILITLTITIIGLLGISSLQLHSNRAITDSGSRSQAAWVLEDLSNRINANSTALASYDTGGDYTENDCANVPVICADYFNAGQKDAAVCTPAQVAAFDIWDLTCPKTYTLSNVEIRESPADFISSPIVNVVADILNNRATITVTWSVRTSGNDNSGEKIYLIDDSVGNLTDSLTREINL